MSSRQNWDSDYSNLDQTVVGNNNGHTSIDNVGMPNLNISTAIPAPLNTTFEFYLPLPNGRIYYVTYTELSTLEIARHLNHRIDLSHIPDDQLSHHHNIHSFIRQQFLQPVDYQQQNNIQQQRCFDSQLTPQIYSDNTVYNAASIPPNETIFDDIRDTSDSGYDGIQGNNNSQQQ